MIKSNRYHGFDALRAAMMLYGIAMHAGLTYSSGDGHPTWPIKDTSRTPVADWLISSSALFRMAAFFMMAGFFAGLLWERRGRFGMLWNRTRRLLIPFAIAWVISFPLLRAAFVFATSSYKTDPWASVFAAALSGRLFASPYPIHLWFLEYLLLYSLVGIVVAPLFRPLGVVFRKVATTPLLTVVGAVLTAPLLAYAPSRTLGIPLSFVPEWVPLLGYGLFFAVGWAMYANAEVLQTIRQWGWPVFIMGLLAACLSDQADPRGVAADRAWNATFGTDLEISWGPTGRLTQGFADAFIMWALVLGLSGLFLRYFDRPIQWVRYLAGASYWLYLAHFPVVAWVAVLLLPFDWPGSVKLLITILLVGIVLMIPYEMVHQVRKRL